MQTSRPSRRRASRRRRETTGWLSQQRRAMNAEMAASQRALYLGKGLILPKKIFNSAVTPDATAPASKNAAVSRPRPTESQRTNSGEHEREPIDTRHANDSENRLEPLREMRVAHPGRHWHVERKHCYGDQYAKGQIEERIARPVSHHSLVCLQVKVHRDLLRDNGDPERVWNCCGAFALLRGGELRGGQIERVRRRIDGHRA